ncbi:MAG: hypothetical protein OXG33_01460 [Chloroflexi bacterium]|nr:hypothetical protein [Chloroflexota bacterium]
MREIRTALINHFEEAPTLLQETLAEVNNDEIFPGDLGQASDEELGRSALYVESHCLLKAGIHIAAVFRANEQNNVHSLGVRARVLIECAAELMLMGHSAVEGTPEMLNRILNLQEFDWQQLMRRITVGQISRQELEASTTRAREGIGLFDGKQPKKRTIADRVSALTQGKMWYDYLSCCFCDGKVDPLRMSPGSGGVLPAPQWQTDLAFAVILNCALTYVCQMLLAYGVIRMKIGESSQLFDEASALFDRTRETAAPVRSWLKEMSGDDSIRTDGGAIGGE